MWSTFIMDLLLMLQAYGHPLSAGSDASLFDFNANGVIDMYDFLQMLSQQPPPPPLNETPCCTSRM